VSRLLIALTQRAGWKIDIRERERSGLEGLGKKKTRKGGGRERNALSRDSKGRGSQVLGNASLPRALRRGDLFSKEDPRLRRGLGAVGETTGPVHWTKEGYRQGGAGTKLG